MARPIPPTKSSRAFHRQGFTLVEAMMACTILAILVLGVCGTLATSYRCNEMVHGNGQAVQLGLQLADEIVSKPLADPVTGSETLGGSSTGAARDTFTHVTSYNGYSDVSTDLSLLSGGTLDVTNSDSYSRSVSVVVGTPPSIDTASPATDFAVVTVTVTDPYGKTISIPEFVANYQLQRY